MREGMEGGGEGTFGEEAGRYLEVGEGDEGED